MDIARDRDRDQIKAADAAVCWIEGDPTGSRHVDLSPGVGRSGVRGALKGLIGIVKIAGDQAAAKAKPARRLKEQHREIPAGSAAEVQGFNGRLGSLVLPALVTNPRRDAGAQVF